MIIKKISVVVCTYNGEKFITSQIESILSQTVKPDEIVIFDDCSTDNTVKILEEMYSAQKNIYIYVNKENIGCVKNFERALKHSSGDIIFFADQDDIWKNRKIEKVVNIFNKNEETLMVFSDGEMIDGEENILGQTLWDYFGLKKRINNFSKDAFKCLLTGSYITGATMAIKREMLLYCLPLPEEFMHDSWLAYIASSFNKLNICEDRLIFYRVHESQQIGLQKKSKKGIYFEKNVVTLNNEIIKMDILYEKLIENRAKEDYLKILLEKKSFYEQRTKLSLFFGYRIIQICKLLKYYFIYSSGVKSIIKDILRG